jgi:flagellar biosynthetic protein FlhB
LQRFIESSHEIQFEQDGLGAALLGLVARVSKLLMVPAIILVIAAIGANVVQKGILFAPKKLEPKLQNISIKAAFKIFSLNNASEFIKGLIKLSIVSAVGIMVLIPQFQRVDTLPMMELPQVLAVMNDVAIQLLLVVVSIIAVVAGIDVAFQRYQYSKKMRMTKVELKDEYKQAEGDPLIKSKLRQIRSERARLRMMSAIPEADVVVANPTHFAIALKYKPDEMDAPRCIAKGQNLVVLRIREIAEENNIAIVKNPPLTQALYASVEVDVEIPPEHYKAVAEVISYVWSLKGRLAPA